MEWLNPTGWWAWLGIPLVIILYLLRHKAAQHVVPSLFLWRKMECETEAQRPFQKLRKQWLLILQLLMVALLAVSLMRPVGVGGEAGELVFVFDISASMQTQSQGKSRLQEATEDAARRVDTLPAGSRVTVLTAGQAVEQVLVRSEDAVKIKDTLHKLQAENGAADMIGAVSLALAMKRDLPEISIFVYSDAAVPLEEQLNVFPVGQGENNRSVLSLRCSEQEEGMVAFVRIANYGAACEISLECYGDGVLSDIRTVSLEAGQQTNVQMLLPEKAAVVWVEITTRDGLMADNAGYWVRQEPTQRKALLVTEGNVFLEKALSLRQDITLYRTRFSELGTLDGYDLYLFDGNLPEELPRYGSIVAFSPDRALGNIAIGEKKESAARVRATVSAQGEKLTQNLLLTDLSLRDFHPVSGGEGVLACGEDILLSVEEQDGRKTAVFGFDLHDSNLPMLADFPILMQNLIEYLLPANLMAADSAVCGQTVLLGLDERTEAARIVTPSGASFPITDRSFQNTKEIGIYTLWEERVGEPERASAFALHIPISESDVRQVTAEKTAEGSLTLEKSGRGKEWTAVVLLILLLFVMVEWEVSRRGS